MHFAESEGGVPPWAVGVIALVSAAGGAAVVILRVLLPYKLQVRSADDKARADKRQQRRDEYSEALQSYKEMNLRLVNELEEQGKRRERLSQSQQLVIDALQKENVECREEAAELRMAVRGIHGTLCWHHQALVAAGHDPGPLPQMPAVRDRPKVVEAITESLVRQAAHSETIIKEHDAKIAEQKAKLNES